MWTAFALLCAAQVALLVVVTKVAIDREHDNKRLCALEANQRRSAAENWEEETTIYSVRGVPTLGKMPWRIRLQWWRERWAARWRKLLNL